MDPVLGDTDSMSNQAPSVAAAEREAMEDQLNACEAGIADVLEAYQGAAAAHAAAAGASWPVDALVAGSTTPFLTR